MGLLGISEKPKCDEARVREIVQELLKELGLARKVDSITFRPEHDWYIVRFYSPPSVIIPRKHFQDYLASQAKDGKQEIIDILTSRRARFDEV
jgi:hypothetical protein